MEIKEILLKSFGGQARELLDKYPTLMADLAKHILAVSEVKMNAKTEKERQDADEALLALQTAATASIKARVKEDSLKAIADTALTFAIHIVRATVLA